jgi:hypothetical protein
MTDANTLLEDAAKARENIDAHQWMLEQERNRANAAEEKLAKARGGLKKAEFSLCQHVIYPGDVRALISVALKEIGEG